MMGRPGSVGGVLSPPLDVASVAKKAEAIAITGRATFRTTPSP